MVSFDRFMPADMLYTSAMDYACLFPTYRVSKKGPLSLVTERAEGWLRMESEQDKPNLDYHINVADRIVGEDLGGRVLGSP